MNESEAVALADALRGPDAVLTADPRTNAAEILADRQKRIEQLRLAESVPHAIRVHFETAKNLYLYAWFVYRFYPVAEQHALSTLEFALRERLTEVLPAADTKNWQQRPPGLKELFERAEEVGLISNEGLRLREQHALMASRDRVSWEKGQEMLANGLESIEWDEAEVVPLPGDYRDDWLSTLVETMPRIRNSLAHGSRMLHPSVLGTFTHVADLINQAYGRLSAPVG
ncbi:MAG TPA: hypothetical protein VIM63_15900 [Rhodoferax sp.]